MRVYRRIEITAFLRRVTISSGPPESGPPGNVALTDNLSDQVVDPDLTSMSIGDGPSQEEVKLGSDKGRRLLADAIRVLENELAREAENLQDE